MEFQGVGKEDSDGIIGYFDKGVAHIRFEMMVKISLWQQLPLYLCATGADDAALAAEHLGQAKDMYDNTRLSTRLFKLTHKCLGNSSEIQPHIERSIQRAGRV